MKMLPVKLEEEKLTAGIETIDSSSAVDGYNFFRLLFPDEIFMKQMILPRSFSEIHIDKQNKHWQIAELRNPKAKSWKVNLYKDPQGFYCFNGEGWQRLASAHHLKLGYFLTFNYNGGMLFNFRVYGLNTIEIQNYPSQEKEDEKKDIFEAVISTTNLMHAYMNIPKTCKKIFELSKKENMNKVVLMDEEGRKWPVRLVNKIRRLTDSDTRSYIASGWLSFAKGNGLRKGDRCVFELVYERLQSLIKVRIIRGDI